MALIGIQAALFLAPKPSTADVLGALRRRCGDLAAAAAVSVEPLDPGSAAALADARAFAGNGSQALLLCRGSRVESTVRVSLLDAHPHTAALVLQPSIMEADRGLTDLTWDATLRVTKRLVEGLRPIAAQVNGLDEAVGGQIASPREVTPGKVPPLLTPFTYVAAPAGDALARAAEVAGAFAVERLATGWAVQFVPGFYSSPPRDLDAVLERAFGADAPVYRQTEVDEAT